METQFISPERVVTSTLSVTLGPALLSQTPAIQFRPDLCWEGNGPGDWSQPEIDQMASKALQAAEGYARAETL